jgi:hypothetical protein
MCNTNEQYTQEQLLELEYEYNKMLQQQAEELQEYIDDLQ